MSRVLPFAVLFLLSQVLGASSEPTELARLLAADGTEVVGGAMDGRTLVGSSGGVCHVFTKPAGGWRGDLVASATLRASDGARLRGAQISRDTVVCGGSYVFVRPPGGWSGDLTEQARLAVSGDATTARLSEKAVIAGDVIAALGEQWEPKTGWYGTVHVYVKPRHGWAGTMHEQAKLRKSSPGSIHFEDENDLEFIAISGDAIFAGTEHELGHAGAIYVFTKPTAGWEGLIFEQARLSPSDAHYEDHFADGMAVHGDTVVAGSQPLDRDSEDPRSAYIFVEPPGGWAFASHEQATLPQAREVSVHRDTIVTRHSFLSAFVKPAGGWSGRLEQPALQFALGPAVVLPGDMVMSGSRLYRLGLDADSDGLSDALELKLGTDPHDEDGDRDGIIDGSDPGWLAHRVDALSPHVLRHPGNRQALLGVLRGVDRQIATGDRVQAIDGLGRLRRRMDGCEPAADPSDWIVECTAQRQLRTFLDILIENLES